MRLSCHWNLFSVFGMERVFWVCPGSQQTSIFSCECISEAFNLLEQAESLIPSLMHELNLYSASSGSRVLVIELSSASGI